MRFLMISTVLSGLFACSGSTLVIDGGTAATKEKDTANHVKGFAKNTPPAGARSMGTMTSPRVGTTTIPIENVEVYVFTADIDDDESSETLYWALEDDVVYVWGDIDLACVDEDGIETGEIGIADFIYELDSEGYGWMIATDSCGYSTLFGCSGDDAGEVCGGCDFDDDYIVCAES
jgi:hypothetical protein